jgi:hypothetical protein
MSVSRHSLIAPHIGTCVPAIPAIESDIWVLRGFGDGGPGVCEDDSRR